jgi:hypothetical protein
MVTANAGFGKPAHAPISRAPADPAVVAGQWCADADKRSRHDKFRREFKLIHRCAAGVMVLAFKQIAVVGARSVHTRPGRAALIEA